MFNDDKLDKRKKDILQAIIEDYIVTAEPVGSRSIAKRHNLGFSSATIRNEMSDLEEMGYLTQPYTSAGRIPSQKGYRLYVDELVKYCELSKSEMTKMRDLLDIRISDVDELIKSASALISEITEYVSIGVTPKIDSVIIKTIRVIPIQGDEALVVLVADGGLVKNTIINIDKSAIDDDQLQKISNYLNVNISGESIEDVKNYDTKDVTKELEISKEMFQPFMDGIIKCIDSIDTSVFMDGAINIFNQPEYQDVIKAKNFLNVMKQEDKILEIMSNSIASNGIFVRIGSENLFDELKESSLITATYSVDDIIIGSIGILGPTRMKYGKVLTAIECASESLNKQIKRLASDQHDRR